MSFIKYVIYKYSVCRLLEDKLANLQSVTKKYVIYKYSVCRLLKDKLAKLQWVTKKYVIFKIFKFVVY